MTPRHLVHLASRARCLTAIALLFLMAAEPALAEISPHSTVATALPASMPEAQALEITILEGEGALNNITQRTAREPIIQVTDANHKPVAGASVLFAIRPAANGAGGSFTTPAGVSSDLRTVTDANGRAQGTGLHPNTISGNFYIRVTATLGAASAVVIIHQQNVVGAGDVPAPVNTPKKSVFPKKPVTRGILIGSIIAIGVILAIIFTRGKGGAHITAGNGSVTNPPGS